MLSIQKLTLSILVGIGIWSGLAFAQVGPDSFLVEVKPSSFQQNQPVDITITAMKNGAIYPMYTGTIFLSIKGQGILPSEYTVPTKGFYKFISDDLGQKTLSKGIEIKKNGEFTISVEDMEQTTLYGSTKVTVSSAGVSTTGKKIDILYPTPNTTETLSTLLVVAKAPELPSSLADIYLNTTFVAQTNTDAEGYISYNLPVEMGFKEGKNTLEIVITNLMDEELGRSEIVEFIYAPLSGDLFKEITATPNSGLRLGDGVTFDIKTDALVSSVNILFSNGQNLPADKIADGHFSRTTSMITTGTLSISVETMATQKSTYSGVLSLFIDDSPLITNVTFKLDPQNPKNLHVSRTVTGMPVDHFEVKYGRSRDNLDQQIEVERPEIIFQNIDTLQEYFFQITPLLGDQNTHGASTDIYTYSPLDPPPETSPVPSVNTGTVIVDMPPSHSTCSIKGIRVTTQKIGGSYYLVWDAVANATSYTVLMSDATDPFNKRKLLDTKDTRYEYPFDHSAEQNQYAYFRVEATCDDGQVLEITSAKKVQVGPTEDILMLICVSLLIYAGIRLYRYTE